MSAQRLPAYAKDLADARRRGFTLRDGAVSVSLHWGPRPNWGFGVIVPNDEDPRTLDWAWCRNLDVMIVRVGDSVERVAHAASAIGAAWPRSLLLIDRTDPKVILIVRHGRALKT